MFAMRKKLDPDAPDIIAFPEPESSTEKRCEIHGGIIGCPCGLGVSEREKIAREVERIYGPHDRRFKTAIEIADKIRKRLMGRQAKRAREISSRRWQTLGPYRVER